MFKNNIETADSKLEIHYNNDKKLTSMLRAISIGATTISAYQIASIGLSGAPTIHIDWLNTDLNTISLVSIPFGYVFGSRLENAFSSNAQKLSELSGKTFKQESRLKDLRGAKAGFGMALALNIITFTGGVYFSAYTAKAIQAHFSGDKNKAAYYIKLKEGNTKRMEQDLRELSPEAIKAYVNSHRMDGESQTDKIEASYKELIKKAEIKQSKLMKKLDEEYKQNLTTKVRARHKAEDMAWIEKKYKNDKEKIERELKNLKAEFERVLKTSKKVDIDPLKLEKERKAELEKDISKLTIANDALDDKIEAIKNQATKSKRGVSWLSSLLIALGFYGLQWLANIAEQRSFDRLQRKSRREEIKDENFDLGEFVDIGTKGHSFKNVEVKDEIRNKDDDKFLSDIAELIEETGKIPNTFEVSKKTGLHISKVAKYFNDRPEYFIRQNGKPTVATEEFLNKYIKSVA